MTSRSFYESVFTDIRLTVRALLREPRLTAVAIILTALVVGGNTTIYSVVHALLSKAAPGVEGHRLVMLTRVREGIPLGPELAYRSYREFARQSQSVRPLIAYGFDRFTARFDAGVYALRGSLVTTGYFETLGVTPLRGRIFSAQEHGAEAGGLFTVISERLWRTELGAADNIVGRQVVLNGLSATVVGVAPAGFQGATIGEAADVWVPVEAYARMRARNDPKSDWQDLAVVPIGRLAETATMDQARAEMGLIAERVRREDPKALEESTVEPGAYSMLGTGSPIHQQAPRLLALFSVVAGLTLIIVCANVGNLMLARSVGRRREFALRVALGASRGHIFRLLLLEGLLLGLTAWALACGLAVATSRGLAALIPPDRQGIVVRPDFTPDWQVAVYAMVLAVAAGFLFTLVPAIRAWRQDALPALKAGQPNVAQGRSRITTTLVILQLAFSVLLLTTAGLAYRSLGVIESADVGFKADDLLLVTVNTNTVAQTRDENERVLQRLRDALRTIPGATAATYARGVPGAAWAPEEVKPSPTDAPVRAQRNDVGPDYFEALGVSTQPGGSPLNHAASGAPLRLLVNQHLAEALWRGESPVGRSILLRSGERAEIAGVVPNGMFAGFDRDPRPKYLFTALSQTGLEPGEFTFHVKMAVQGAERLDAMAPVVRAALRDVSTDLPVVYIRTMETQLRSVTWLVRVVTILLVTFAAVALFIATLGQYAVMEFTTRRRTRDVGVRMAFGATSSRIIQGIVREGLVMTVAGLVLGFMLSVLAASALRALLVGITPADPVTYIGVIATLGLISMLACYIPARRAANINPVQALREE